MRKRVLSIVIAAAMCLTLLPAWAWAAETDADDQVPIAETQVIEEVVPVDPDDLPDNDELFAGYVEQTMYAGFNYGISLFGVSAGARLDGNNKTIYDKLKTEITEVANGTETSTEFTIDTTNMGITYNSTLSGVDTGTILDALLADCPYDLYWFDKTTGMSTSYNSTSGSVSTLTFKFAVSQDYAATDSDYTTDSSKTSVVSMAVEAAKAIVEKYAEDSDYEKLVGYKDEICNLVSYNHDAAANDYTGGYGDPWQLIYVFDNDSTTNVVCEGYSKAFQYLCDLSQFEGDVICYTVTGTMSGGTGEGNHMWNIVTMDDGKNYLVDVTNCDGFSLTVNGNSYSWSSSVGFPDRLFLVGASGSVDDGYTCTTEEIQYTDPESNITVTLSAGEISYKYDDDQKILWGTDILTLASANYTPPTALPSLGDAEVTLDPTSDTYDGTEHKPSVTVKLNEETLTEDTDYTVSYSDNTNAGTATVTVTGIGDYTGSQTVEFTIDPATPTIAWSETSQTLTYTGEEANITAPTVTLVNNETFSGTIKYSYRLESDTTSDFTSGLPTNVGSYTVKASIDAFGNYAAAESTNTLTLTINKASYTEAPTVKGNFTQVGETYTYTVTVTNLVETVTYEYSNNGTTWQNSNTFTDIAPGSTHTFYARIAATDNYEAGAAGNTGEVAFPKLAGSGSVTMAGWTYGDVANAPAPASDTNGTDKVSYQYKIQNAADSTYTDAKPTNAGTYTVKATFAETDTYTAATAYATFTIDPKSINGATVEVDGTYTYTGNAQTPTSITVTLDGTALTADNYTVAYTNNINAGAATATVTGKGNYTGTATGSFTIAKANLTQEMFNSIPVQAYTGSEVKPEISIADDYSTALNSSDYSIAYSNNTAAADANGTTGPYVTITATNKGNYAESVTLPFTITASDISAATVVVNGTYTYNGSAQTPSVTVTMGSKTLVQGTDYTITASNNTNAGTASFTINGMGNYSGQQTGEFTIAQATLTPSISGTTTKIYDGMTSAPGGLSITLDGVVTGDDVTATATSYAYNSANVSEANTITATGITLSGGKADNYKLSENTATASGSITAKDISNAEVTLGGELTFNGSAQTQSITSVIVDGLNVTYNVSKNTGTDADNYTLTITGTGNFTGSVTSSWNIAKAAAPTVEQQEKQHLRASSATGSIDLGALLPADRGTTTYSVANESYSGLESDVTVTDGKLTYTTKVMSSETTDTIKVTAEMANYETATITVTVKLVEKTSVTITGVTAQNGTYNGSAQAGYTGTPVSNYTGDYTVTYTGRNGTTCSSATAPTAAGDYTVTIAVPDSDAQYTGNTSLNFTIAKKSITITGVTAQARDYEAGKTTVTLTGGTLDGVVNGDDVSFTLGTGAIADANAGTGKAVTVTGSALTGNAAGNYTLTEPTGITVTINKINPTYTAPSNVTAVFGQTLADAVIGTPGTGGNWTWETPAEKVGNVGTNNHNMVLTPTDSTNYNTVTTAVPVAVSKAAAPTLADQTVSVKYNAAGEQTVSLAALMPADAGALSYAAGTKTDSDGIIGSWSVSGGTLTYALTSGLDSTKAGKTATLPVTISSANYEDATVNVVVTLTDLQAQAALSINSGTAVTYGSTLALTTSGGSGSGAVTFTVTNGTGEAVVSGSTLTPTKAGTVTVTATKAADGTYAEAAATLTITINPASIANAKVTLNPTAIAGSVNDDEARTTNVESVKLNGSTLTAGKDYTVSIPTGMKKAGDYTITITGTGNYTGTATATFTINPVTEAPALPPELTETDTNKFKVEVETGLSEVPAAFTGNAELNTPEKIETKLTTEITTVNTAIPETNVAVYDVTLMVSTDSGLTWTKASADNFPTGGKLTVTLPYPEGTDSSYTFTVVHMFTTSDFGKTPGETETPTVTNTADGIQFQVTGLSPISVGWTAPKPNNNGGHGSHGGYIPTTITYPVIVDTVANGTVEASVARAAKGTTVTITAIPDEGYELVDLVVLDAATKVSLTQIGENKFTFKMPAASVMIQAAFTKIIKALPFTDVRAGVYYYDSVVWAVENEITDGYGSATTFAPDVKCSRAEAVTFLWRAAGQPKPMTTENPFTDVSENAYYYQAVLWAVENGITNGYNSDTTFAPDVKCSRAEIVTFLYRAAGSPVVSSGGSFDDVSENAYYAKAVAWAVKYGITDGYGSDIFFVPDEKCSRAEIVTFLYRTYAD